MQGSSTCAFAGARACRKRRGRYMRGRRTRMVTIADEVDGEARRPARPAVFASSTRSGSAASPADDVGAVLFAQGGASREQAIPARVAPGVCVAVSLLADHGSHRRKSERAVLATTSFLRFCSFLLAFASQAGLCRYLFAAERRTRAPHRDAAPSFCRSVSLGTRLGCHRDNHGHVIAVSARGRGVRRR